MNITRTFTSMAAVAALDCAGHRCPRPVPKGASCPFCVNSRKSKRSSASSACVIFPWRLRPARTTMSERCCFTNCVAASMDNSPVDGLRPPAVCRSRNSCPIKKSMKPTSGTVRCAAFCSIARDSRLWCSRARAYSMRCCCCCASKKKASKRRAATGSERPKALAAAVIHSADVMCARREQCAGRRLITLTVRPDGDGKSRPAVSNSKVLTQICTASRVVTESADMARFRAWAPLMAFSFPLRNRQLRLRFRGNLEDGNYSVCCHWWSPGRRID
mmetsp:Transcript_16471/g.51134  ORF Transcript_16471/g.51134 Transcript_16471/m.51134 type:complete len:274 (+) Transcript_16471:937-1758(+)